MFPGVCCRCGRRCDDGGDRRTTGTYIEDESIELKAANQISLKYKDTAHVNVACFNRHVLVTGEAPNEDAKSDISKIVAGITNVKAVSNELVISGKTRSLLA